MKRKHYLNLTNGLEDLREVESSGEPFSFLRIQSTALEQKRYDWLIADLDNDFLMNLALGCECVVHDCSAHSRVPRAVWQGIEFVRYACSRVWFDVEDCPDRRMIQDFRVRFKTLSQACLSKLRYYKRFVLTDAPHISTVCRKTNRDGDYDFYREIVAA